MKSMKIRNHIRFLIIFAVLFISTAFVFVQPVNAYVSLSVTGQVVPSTIEPGEGGNLVLTIANGGTSYARNIKLKIKPHSYITFGQTSYELQTIAPSSSNQISIPITILSSIPEGTTSIFFTISYSEGSSTGTNTMESSTSISVSRRSLVQIENVSWDKELIQPGDVVNVDIDLKNVGFGIMKDTTVAFGNTTQPFVSASGDLEVYIGGISTARIKTASFSIIVNKAADTVAYRVPIRIRYYDESSTLNTEIKYIGMKISGHPDFVMTLEDDSEMVTGKAGEVTISIANRGTATAGYLTASFDSDLDVIPAEYYVGNLDPDDYETITLSVDLSAVAPGRRQMSISMVYKDPYNQEITEYKTLEFKVHARPPMKISLTTQIIIFAVIIIIIYWKRKFLVGIFRRKK